MTALIKIPYLNPMRFFHDGNDAASLVPGFFARAQYFQPYKMTDEITLQFHILKEDLTDCALEMYDCKGYKVGSTINLLSSEIDVMNGYSIIHYSGKTFNELVQEPGIFRFKLSATIDEDIHVFFSEWLNIDEHENTVLIEYSNEQNDFGVIFPLQVEGIWVIFSHIIESFPFTYVFGSTNAAWVQLQIPAIDPEWVDYGDPISGAQFNSTYIQYTQPPKVDNFRFKAWNTEPNYVFSDESPPLSLRKYFLMRVHGGAMPTGFTPASRDKVYFNQIQNAVLLNSVPFHVVRWNFGDTYGLPNWVADKLNRIFACTDVLLNGMQWVKNDGAAMEENRVEEYPFAGWSIEMVRADNNFSREYGEGELAGDYNDDYNDDHLI